MNDLTNLMTAEEIWETTLAQLQSTVDKQSFSTWFGKASFSALEDRTFVITVENPFVRDMLEKRLTETVEGLLRAQTGDFETTVAFRIKSDRLSPEANPAKTQYKSPPAPQQ